ncbi:MAG TPA: FlgD immunoglobulin-like domain containing protein, partial [bacterium]
PTQTLTPNPTLVYQDVFYVSENQFVPSQGPVSIYVKYAFYPGNFKLTVFNSAGELVKELDSRQLNGPFTQSYTWDGTNKYGEKCADGVYVIYLMEPFSQKMKRLLLRK